MKNDINLLNKRKIRTYSNKKVAVIVLVLVLLAAGMYAGIAIPSNMLSVAKIEAAQLDSQINSSTETQQGLKEKTQKEAALSMQLAELKAIDGTRLDMEGYLDAVEKSLPTNANLTELQFTDDAVNIMGTAQSDKDVATFCLRLREQNAFKDVYITNSTSEAQILTFSIAATLPAPLSNVVMIEAIEQINTAPSAPAQPAASAAPAPEVTN